MAMEMYQGGLTPEQLEALQAPLDANLIKHRPGGGGKMLKYIKGDTAIDTANRLFGFGKWGYKVVSRGHEIIVDEKKGQQFEYYTADIELSVVGAAFPFPGDGVGIVNAPFTVEMHEKARKEATTDALKRALRHYGDQFGLCLYDEDDYVMLADGTMDQVKNVKPGSKQPAPKRVVDATQTPKQLPQAQPRQIQSTSTIKAPTPSQLRKRCDGLFGTGQWDQVQTKLFNCIIPDDNMTPEDCEKMQHSLDIVVQKRASKAS